MATQRNVIPMPANYGRVLKMVTKTYFTAEWISVEMINGIRNIHQEIEGFDAAAFFKEAIRKGDLVEVGGKYRLDRSSRYVIKAAMEAGRIAGVGKAGEKAGEIYHDADDFQAFCMEVYGLHSSWFELKTYEDQIRKSLKLSHEFWPLDSLQLLFKELAGYAPSIILVRGVAGGGYKYRIQLPKHLLPVEPSATNQVDLNDENEGVNDEETSSVAPNSDPEMHQEGEMPAEEVSMSANAQSYKVVTGQALQYLTAMLRHYPDRRQVMSTGDVTKKLAYLDVRWETPKLTGWLFAGLKKAGALIQCDAEGALSEKSCGYVRFNLEHPEVKEVRKAKVQPALQPLSDEDLLNMARRPFGREVYVQSLSEPESGSPALTSEDENEDRGDEELTAPAAETSEPSLEVTVTETVSETETSVEADVAVQVAPSFTGFQSVEEVEAALKAHETKLAQNQARRNEITVEKAGLKARLAALEAEDASIAEMATFDQQKLILLNQELTRLKHEADLRAVQLKLQVAELLASLPPKVVELLKARLLQG